MGAGENSPGVRNLYIGAITDGVITEGTDGSIAMLTGTGTLFRFKCDNLSSDWSEPGAHGVGGQEYLPAVNYNMQGISQAKRNLIESLMECPEVIIIAEGRKGDSVNKFWLLGEKNFMNPTTSNTATGVGGGGPAAITNTVSWAGNEPKKAKAFELTAAQGLIDALATITISAT